MNLKNKILAGGSCSLEFRLALNGDRIKCLEMAVTFADGWGGWRLVGMKENRNERRRT